MAGVTGASNVSRPPMGIVAPQPQSLISTNIKAGQKVELRPGEPVFLFIPTRVGSGTKLQALNKDTPFSIKRLASTPPGVPGIRTPGQWYQLSLKQGEKVGQRDQVQLVTTPVVGPNVKVKSEVTRFTLLAGGRRFY